MDFFIKGAILGLSIAAPVGPVAVLCINRTLAKGYSAGLATGLGAAIADVIYGIMAGLGLTAISQFLLKYSSPIQLIGVIYLAYLGISTLLSKPSGKIEKGSDKGLLGDFTSGFILTLSIPIIVLGYVAIFASLGIGTTTRSYTPVILFILGEFIGSGGWWLILSTITNAFRSKITLDKLAVANFISGLIILGFAGFLLKDILVKFRMF